MDSLVQAKMSSFYATNEICVYIVTKLIKASHFTVPVFCVTSTANRWMTIILLVLYFASKERL